ncbi:hypothetical protein LTR85_005979 [Meristemomyces frigidus]|nr:hypothetical protein LTR85_005979 [Meristemomyces frigidus]
MERVSTKAQAWAGVFQSLQAYVASDSPVGRFRNALLLLTNGCDAFTHDVDDLVLRTLTPNGAADLQFVDTDTEIPDLTMEVLGVYERLAALHGRIVELAGRRPDSVCPISLEQCKDPVTTVCGHTFCRECLAGWLAEHNSCPFCRGKVK